MSGSAARRLAALGVSTVLVLAGGEIAARLFARSHWDSGVLAVKQHLEEADSLAIPVADPAIHYRLRPGLDLEYEGARVVTDASGVRVGSISASDSPDALRIALVGDSTPFGWRVAYEDSYGERVRRALEVELARPVVLRNCAVPGYDADQEFHAFVEMLPAFRPDLLIVHHDHNDWQPVGWNERLVIPPERGDNVLHSALIKLIARRIEKIRIRRAIESERGANEFLGEYCTRGPFYEAMMESRRRLIEAARQLSIPAVVLLFNSDVALDPAYETNDAYVRLHRSAKERLSGMGYLVLDLYPPLQRALAASGAKDMHAFWLDEADHHPNAQGHAFVADTLVDFLSHAPELQSLLRTRR